MNIKVLQYIDNTPKNNITTGQVNATGDSSQSNNNSTVNSTGADFGQVLDDTKKAEAAVAIDRLIAQNNGGSVDISLVQRFFEQNGINIKLCSSTAPQAATVNNTAAYSGSSAGVSSDTDTYNTAASKASGISSSSVRLEASGLSCSAQLDAIFNEAASKYGVDAKFLKSIAKCESDFSPECTSSSGAMGIMQLMPQTAASLGVTNAYDPYQNIMGGARYISEKLAQYNGDKSLALAAYNAGSGNVAKYGGIPPFKETQNYVAKVMAYYNS